MSGAAAKKVRLGQFYTSAAVVELMIELADVKRSARILEPGFGEGAFLSGLLAAGFTDVHGCDVDPENLAHVRDHLPSGALTLSCGDYLRTPREERFDLIIGNPPYVKSSNIDPATKAILKEGFWAPLSNGEWDLLYAFIVWSVEKLEDEGELIFIVPYNWLNATYAQSLRDYLLARGSFELFIHFSEYKLFADCAPNALIFKYRKGARRVPRIKVAEFEGRRGDTGQLLADARRGLASLSPAARGERRRGEWRFFTSRHPRRGEAWYLASAEQERTVRSIERAAPAQVGEHFHVAVGLVSGHDDAYSLSPEQADRIPESERELVIEMAKASSCSRYEMLGSRSFIFADRIDSEQLLRDEYPHIHAHLSRYRKRLSRRFGADPKRWWHWATVRNRSLFESRLRRPKVFVPGIDRSPLPRFCLSDQALYGAGDVVCISSRDGISSDEDVFYLLAWLNSGPVSDWYRIKGSRTGQRIRYTQAYLSRIPFRPIDRSDPAERARYKRIVDAARRASTPGVDPRARSQAESQIEKEISALLKASQGC